MIKAKILKNLKEHGNKWVTPFIALDDIFGEDGSMESLIELVREGTVEKQIVDLGNDRFGQAIRAPLYRAAPNYNLFNDSPATLVLLK